MMARGRPTSVQPMLFLACDGSGRGGFMPRAGGGTGVGPEVKVTGNQVSVLLKSGGFLNYTYLCLPDTVDPRGPSGR